MLKEQEKENIRESIRVILKMALTVEATRDEYGEDLAERLENTAKKIQTTFGIEESIMKEFHDAKETSKKWNLGMPIEMSVRDIKEAREMIYALCDMLESPKEIMYYVRNATEMVECTDNSI